METKTFYTQLSLVTIFTVLSLLGMHTFPQVAAYAPFSWICIGFFVVFSVLIYTLGKRTAVSEDRNAFSRLALGSIGGKMFLSVFLVMLYYQLAQPESKFFLLSFFIVYLVYTIFETYVLMRLSKEGNKT